jgi:dinuclear metal center YbgI/SA1388 family protein
VYILKVKDVLDYLNGFAPFDMSEDWDNCGLLIGSENDDIKGILVCVDVTESVLDEAIKSNKNLIIAHHPIIFGGINSVLADTIIYKAIKAGMSVIGFHTCYDNCNKGVSYILAKTLGLKNITQNALYKSLFVGEKHYKNVSSLAKDINSALDTNSLFIDTKKPIMKIAVCGGSGGDFLNAAFSMGADAFVTGECKYHELLEAYEKGFTVITAGHFETEFPAMADLMNSLKKNFPVIDVTLSYEKPPFRRLI